MPVLVEHVDDVPPDPSGRPRNRDPRHVYLLQSLYRHCSDGSRRAECDTPGLVALGGLAAARRLVARGHEVTVVEARERVGGRTEGLVLDDGTPLELGGQWLGEGHSRMYELAGELGLATFRTWNDEGLLLLDLQGRQSRMKPHKGAVPRISPFAVADLAQGLMRFTRLAARTDLQRPWLTPGAEVLDGQTWESWIRRNLRTKAGRAYFHVACEAVWAAEASDVSLLHALFYAHSNADLETLIAVDRGAQQDRVIGGSVRVAEA